MESFFPARALAVTPHAEDVTLFAGGTLIRWIEQGCIVQVVRVTKDGKDSFDHPGAETISCNHEEFLVAMSILGVSSTIHLGYRDCELRDVPYGELREHLIRAIRKFMPEVIVSFDPVRTDDENPDHGVVAMATADAACISAHPNVHREHQDIGLSPHRALGCYYFTRHFVCGDTVFDVSGVIDRKIRAVTAHRTRMRSLLADQKERITMAGFSMPALDRISLDDYADHWDGLIRAAAALAAKETPFRAVERFRSTVLIEDDPLVRSLSSL